jgi:hypothetical protein
MNGTNTYEQLLDRLNWRYATKQFDPIRRTAPPTGNNRLTIRSAIFAVCSSERNNNKQQQTNAKTGNTNMKIKNNTEITSRLTGRRTLLAVLVAAGTLAGATAFAQSAKEIRGASPYVPIENEPAPKLIVDRPLPDLLDQGVVWIQYRTENVHIVPVFGKGALNASPRVGHLHVHIDDLPWWWADASDNNTIDLAGMPPGPHKVRIELVDVNHEVFPGQSKTVTFTVAGPGSHRH